MRASRLLSILMLLQVRGRQSAEALAREFEVSVRTVYRDIDALSAAGVPVYAQTGRHGGIALHDGYQTRLTGLTRAEALALPLAGLGAVARDLGVEGEAAAAQLKLLASLPRDAGASAERIASRFHLDALPWYHRLEALECLPRIAQAVWDARRVRMEYESWKGAVRREVNPLGLALKGGIWYLVGEVQGRVRTYRVSSVARLEVLDAGFRRPRRFDLRRYWREWVDDFEARLMRERATVRISPEGCRILRAVNPAAAQMVAASRQPSAPEGWVEARFPIESEEYSARQILRLGAEVEVLAPASLRGAVAREAGRVAAMHRPSSRARARAKR